MADIFDLFKKIEKSPAHAAEPVSFVIVGLGNPGPEYVFTRHNAGFLVLDYVCQKLNVKIDRSKFKSLVGEATIGGKRCLLVKPQTYMNASGEAVREVLDFYKLDTSALLVICDDVNLDPGKVRVRKKGSDGGQRGLRSIITELGTDAFTRLRMGVGAKPHPDYDMADWVLGTFNDEDKKSVFSAIERAYGGLDLLVRGDIDRAMNLLN
ncbi:MAG: aminoacyl-tRNA hydrolase [Clostridia bacterium]|nr:aminoacyl-tRNA hydrolase [Clostridia bacterium]